MTTHHKNLFSIHNLSVSFTQGSETTQAVDDVSLSVTSQEIVGIVGESGSGKSVSLLGALKLLPPNAKIIASGISWKSKNIYAQTYKEIRPILGKEIAYIYQEPSLSYDPLTTIYATFKELFRAHHPKITNQEILSRTMEILDEVGIINSKKRLKNYFHQFSGGMIQRVQIALALALNPQILIADEPTTALDVINQKIVVELLLHLCKIRKMAMIFITHDLALISNFADKIIVMKDGKIVEEGTPQDILYYPQKDYTRTLLNATIKFGDRHVTKR